MTDSPPPAAGRYRLPRPSAQTLQGENRLILAHLDELLVVFPAPLVSEILMVERSRILPLPFYPAAVLGILHHSSDLVPILSLRMLAKVGPPLHQEKLVAIRLSAAAGNATGVALVVDRAQGSRPRSAIPDEVMNSDLLRPQADSADELMKLFRVESLDRSLWQPRRWLAAV